MKRSKALADRNQRQTVRRSLTHLPTLLLSYPSAATPTATITLLRYGATTSAVLLSPTVAVMQKATAATAAPAAAPDSGCSGCGTNSSAAGGSANGCASNGSSSASVGRATAAQIAARIGGAFHR